MEKWCIRSNGFDIRDYWQTLRKYPGLFDVTLATDDGQHIQAHKIILSAGSHFFSDIFLKSNQTNMLIYLKGMNSVQLEHLLDFIYNGEASVGQEKIGEFLKTGKELQVKGFEAYLSSVGENAQGDSVRYSDDKEDIHENRDNIIEDIIISNTLKPFSEQKNSSEFAFKEIYEGKIPMNENSDLDLQILEMIEKSDVGWKCKLCGKTSQDKSHIREHAETHIEGMSHVCHICNKHFSHRSSLRKHIKIHSKFMSCDLCGKSGMNKSSYNNHKRTQHETLVETLSSNKLF